MKPPPFEYTSVSSLDEALALLAEHGDEAKVLAGGQSLIPLLAMRLARPAQLIDLNGVGELSGISAHNGTLVVGALTRERAAERSAVVAERLPVLAAALPLIGHVSIRNRGTIGGSIAHADASAELPAVAMITDAQMQLRSASASRTVSADEFFCGHFTTCLGDDELLTEVHFPTGPSGAGWAFEEVARRHGDFALVGVAAMVALGAGGVIDQARLCLIGVGERAHRAAAAEAALIGQAPSAESFAAAAEDAVRDLNPAADVHGSSAFRKQLARATVKRALAAATARAGGAA